MLSNGPLGTPFLIGCGAIIGACGLIGGTGIPGTPPGDNTWAGGGGGGGDDDLSKGNPTPLGGNI